MPDIPGYLRALAEEMKGAGGRRVDTVFFGGGTPSLLSGGQIRELMLSVSSRFDIAERAEITLECNPEDGEARKLKAIREAGINRLSFGLQASQDRHLKALGRTHDLACFLKTYETARELGFGNINIDLMFGLPGQSLEDWEETLELAVSLGPEHVSAYALDLDEPSALSFEKRTADEDLEAEMYKTASSMLARAGYLHYEISNFARPAFQCRHNLKYWRNEASIGVGVAAASFDGISRRRNAERLGPYLEKIREGKSPVSEAEILSPGERTGEEIMLGLRLGEGAPLSRQAHKLYGGPLNSFEKLGLLKMSSDGKRAALTLDGWLLSNQIFTELLVPSGCS